MYYYIMIEYNLFFSLVIHNAQLLTHFCVVLNYIYVITTVSKQSIGLHPCIHQGHKTITTRQVRYITTQQTRDVETKLL